jgi:hypothetical protein
VYDAPSTTDRSGHAFYLIAASYEENFMGMSNAKREARTRDNLEID